MPMNIRVQDATLKHDTELIGKMDPYCIITIGNERHKTKTHNKGGKHPSWNQSFNFAKSQDVFMVVEVFDKELIVDDLVGHTTVNLKKYVSSPGCVHNETINIYYKGHDAGAVRLTVEYLPSNTNTQAWNYQPYGAPAYNDNAAWGRNTDAAWVPSPNFIPNIINLTKPTNQAQQQPPQPSPYPNLAQELPSNPYVPANPYVSANPAPSQVNKASSSNPTSSTNPTHTTVAANTTSTQKKPEAGNTDSDVNYDAIWDTPTMANPYEKS